MKVKILPEVHAQIMYYVHKSSVEISGLGRIEKSSDGTMVVTKVYLLEQVNTGTSTDLNADAVAKLQFSSREDKGHLNFWWHSHVNMGAFWSGTDMATIEQFGKNGYLLATVFNKRGEYKTAYYQGGTDFLPSLFVDDIETEFSYLPTANEATQWEAEFTTKCKEKVWAPKQWNGHKSVMGNTTSTDWWKTHGVDNDELYDDDIGYYGRTLSKKERRAMKKQAKSTLLTDDAIDMLDCTTPTEYSLWVDIFSTLKGLKTDDDVDWNQLNNFYNAWKGDYDKASEYVINKLDHEWHAEGGYNV